MSATTRCPNCNAQSDFLFRTKDYDYRTTSESFPYFRCRQCGLIFLFPIPEDLDKYYSNDYYDIPKSLADLRQIAENERYKLNIIQGFKQEGRFLEIGPSYGALSLLAKEAGFSVDALEMDPACCDFLQSLVGVRTIHSSDPLKTLSLLGQYDVIALWHVIEHLDQPQAIVRAIAEHLAPGGIVALAAPNPDALQFKFWRGRWRHLQAPRHLTMIPIHLLGEWAESSGLTLKLITTTDQGSIGLNWLGWYRSAMNLSTWGPLRGILGILGRGVHKLLIPIERHRQRGAAYTVVFQKDTEQVRSSV